MSKNERTDKNLPTLRRELEFECQYCGKRFNSFYHLWQCVKKHRKTLEEMKK